MRRLAAKPAMALSLLLLAAAGGASVFLQREIDSRKPAYQEAPEVLWIQSGEVLKRLSLGHSGLLADIYWTRVVQYYGGRLRDRIPEFGLLGPLLNLTVSLDPYLLIAYKFGAIFLSAQPPSGAGQPEEAIALIQRGIQANPEEWRLWHDLGFIYYWDMQDYPAAAAAYLEGSKHPAAAPWMKVMAAVILEKGGNRDTSRFLWTEIHQSTEDPTIRQNAFGHLQTLKALDDVEELEQRAAFFHEKEGRWPRSFAEMAASGLLGGIPADPTGLPYQLQPDGTVSLHPESEIRLDREPSSP